MSNFLNDSLFAGVSISLIAYMIGVFLNNKYKMPLFNPLLVSVILSIVVLVVADVDYEVYNAGASYLSWFLTPATVCLAIPLYEQLHVLKKNWFAIILAIVSGVITSSVTILVLSKIMKLNHKEYVTLLPKSITTAIGMGLSEEMQGYVTITVAVIIITGVIGNVLGEVICKIFRITHPVAKGLSLGTSAHVLGTAKAMEMGDVEGAMSSLSIVVAGLMTVASSIVFSNLI